MFQPQPTSYTYSPGQRPSHRLQLPLQLHDLGPASHDHDAADYGLYPSTATCTPSPQTSSGPGLLAPPTATNGGTFDAAPAPPRPHRGGPQLGHRPTALPGGGQAHLRHQQQHLQTQHQAQQQEQNRFFLATLLSANHAYGGRLVEMSDPGVHGMAAQQEAAKDYQPNLEGPAVADKVTIDAITNEYAKADPVYVEKTMALPQTYAHYRPIKGDGNCGWRAIGFSYFEKLAGGGDQGQVEGEAARLMSMNHMLGAVGGYTYYEDFADEAIGLLRDLAACISDTAAAHRLVQERWNNPETANAILYYLRLLAATYLKSNAETYDPFVPDGQGIQAHCSQSIDLPDREIEHLGITALVNVLLKPVSFVLEIAYLDRSPGSRVNVYRFPEEANGQEVSALGPIIYLLYRPDHYDILYRPTAASMSASMSASMPSQPVDLQVNRATGFYSQTDIVGTHASLGAFATADFGILASLPFASTPMSDMSSLPSQMPSCASYSTDDSWIGHYPDASMSSSTFQDQMLQQQHQQHQPQPAMHSPDSIMQPGRCGTGPPTTADTGCTIRFSQVQLEYDESNTSVAERNFQLSTNTFKNSVWNRAHFGNPDFHPEEWSPEDEHLDGRMAGRRKRSKE